MRVIVLGATGQIGSTLLHSLDKDHIHITGTTRQPTDKPLLIPFNPFVDDWKLLGTVDVIINCIGTIYETRKNSFEKLHVALVKLLIRNRLFLGHPKIINVSALGASEDHRVSFLRTKGVGDKLLLQEENTYVIRPSIVCTTNTMMLQKLRKLRSIASHTGNRLIVPAGFLTTSIQPVHINDLVELIKHLLFNNSCHRIIDAVGPDRISFHQLLTYTFANHPPQLSYMEINKHLLGGMVRHLIAPLFPSFISYDQFELLLNDNTSDDNAMEKMIGGKLQGTTNFWKTNLEKSFPVYQPLNVF
ncbi:MAG TPA: hypothetical protein VM935_02850 [Chitinophagaceae bacterium]|nr:hypothetical protein [Chitinophagaceae bacterium]